MKLRNKRTGEVYDFKITPDYDDVMSGWKIENKDFGVRYYSHLAELNEEWEDYKEPKDFYVVEQRGIVGSRFSTDAEYVKKFKEIGNYFETKEEAEKAVEKLKAWKRLKNKGFRFDGLEVFSEGLLEIDGVLLALKGADNAERLKIIDDLDLLFGGEE